MIRNVHFVHAEDNVHSAGVFKPKLTISYFAERLERLGNSSSSES